MPELPEVETIKNQIAPHLPLKVVSVVYSEVAGSIVKDKEFSPRGKVLERVRYCSLSLRVVLFRLVGLV